MSLHRRAARRDTSEGPIIDALLACGFSVQRLSAKNVPDLLCGRNGLTRAVEVKTDRKPLTAGQVAWWGAWHGGGAIILRTLDDVYRLSRVWCSLR